MRKPTSTFSKLQAMQNNPSTTSNNKMPAFVRPGDDQMYQASKGGAAATKAPKRASSTFTKLQALSASGTGAAGMHELDDGSLDSLLNRLDNE